MTPLLALLAVAAPLEEARVVISIGSNLGLSHEAPLRYAERDAERFADLMTSLGATEADRVELVLGGGAGAVRAALQAARGRIAEIARSRPTAFVVFVSAHADAEGLHLSGEVMRWSEFRALVRASPAQLRLTVVDACQTAPRTKGGRPTAPVELRLAEDRVAGEVTMTAAGFGEPAQEWRALEGSLFTHHLLSGLRGAADLDADGAVRLGEAYGYAYRATLSDSSATPVGPQRPGFEMDVRGREDWAWTRTTEAGATLVMEPELAGRFMVIERPGGLLAEIDKRAGEPLAIAVRPGALRVVELRVPRARVVDLRLASGERRGLASRDLVATRFSDSVLKGQGRFLLRPWTLAVGLGLQSPLVDGASTTAVIRGGLGRQLGPLRAELELLARGSAVSIGVGSGPQLGVGAAATVGAQWPLGPGEFGLMAGPTTWYVRQWIDRERGEQIERVFGEVDDGGSGWVIGGVLRPGYELGLGGVWALRIEAGLEMLWVPFRSGEDALRTTVGAGLTLRRAFAW
ncbi:MAG: hypothetical protein AAFU79_08000 [Myxococcota bacterium]